MQVPPLPFRQPPQTEEAKRYLESVRGLEASMRELLMQKVHLEKGFFELQSSESRALREMHRARESELKAIRRLNDITASRKRTVCDLHDAQAEIRRYQKILSDQLGPIQCPQSWKNLVQENNKLKEEVQRLLHEQWLQLTQPREFEDQVHSP